MKNTHSRNNSNSKKYKKWLENKSNYR
jgi:hypothetical protein